MEVASIQYSIPKEMSQWSSPTEADLEIWEQMEYERAQEDRLINPASLIELLLTAIDTNDVKELKEIGTEIEELLNKPDRVTSEQTNQISTALDLARMYANDVKANPEIQTLIQTTQVPYVTDDMILALHHHKIPSGTSATAVSRKTLSSLEQPVDAALAAFNTGNFTLFLTDLAIALAQSKSEDERRRTITAALVNASMHPSKLGWDYIDDLLETMVPAYGTESWSIDISPELATAMSPLISSIVSGHVRGTQEYVSRVFEWAGTGDFKDASDRIMIIDGLMRSKTITEDMIRRALSDLPELADEFVQIKRESPRDLVSPASPHLEQAVQKLLAYTPEELKAPSASAPAYPLTPYGSVPAFQIPAYASPSQYPLTPYGSVPSAQISAQISASVPYPLTPYGSVTVPSVQIQQASPSLQSPSAGYPYQ